MKDTLFLGAVAYDPKVVTIWDGFTRFFAERGLAFDYVLYSQLRAPGGGPLPRGSSTSRGTRRSPGSRPSALAATRARTARAVAMRDTDRDLTSVIVVRDDGAVRSRRRPARPPRRRRRGRLAAGDDPAAAPPRRGRGSSRGATSRCVASTSSSGKHGDHVGGERDGGAGAARRRPGRAGRGVHHRRQPARPSRARGLLPDGRDAGARPHGALRPLQLHRARRRARRRSSTRFRELLFGMSYDDSERAAADGPGGPQGVAAWPHRGLRRARARRAIASARIEPWLALRSRVIR